MNLLVVGASHRSAPIGLLERLTVSQPQLPTVLAELARQPRLTEVVLLSTCNRVEVYAAVNAFHAGLADVVALLARRSGCDVAELAAHLYVHHDVDAARHAFRVAAGLDSMVVGEAQILGQLREAYRVAAEVDAVGPVLHELMQQALRVGKAVHAETDIDGAGRSVVSAALELAEQNSLRGLTGRPALVIGAGSMGGLALATLAKAGATPLLATGRGGAGGERVQVAAARHGATAVDLSGPGDLAAALSTVDFVVSATTSPTPVLDEPTVVAALAQRRSALPLTIVDLAVPRDVVPEVAALPGVTVVDLDTVAQANLVGPSSADMGAAEAIVSTQVDAFLTWLRGAEVAPTVAALRARADHVVAVELGRLGQRMPELTDRQRAEVAHAVHRVVRRLLHPPTVRIRQLAAAPDGERYASALRELFDLTPDPAAAAPSVTLAVDLDREEVDPR